MRQPLDEKLESLQDKGGRKTRPPLPRVAAFAAVVALLASVIVIAVGAASIARQGTKTLSSGDPVAPSLAANVSRSQPEEQLQLWRSQIIDGGGTLLVHGASTTAAGDVMHFDGQLLASGIEVDGSEEEDGQVKIDGVVEVVLRRNPRQRLMREWQPSSYSFHVAMLNGSAFVWKSVVSRSGYEYLVSQACVSREDLPVFAGVLVEALLLPASKRRSDLTVKRAFAPGVRQRSSVNNSSKDDALQLLMRNESFDLWQLSRDFAGSASSGDQDPSSVTSGSNLTRRSRTVWMLNGSNVTLSLRLEDDSSEGFDNAVVLPALMLVDYQRAFRSCSSLFPARNQSTGEQLLAKTATPIGTQESVPAAEASDDSEEEASEPLPLRKWTKTLRSSSTPSEGEANDNRRLNVKKDDAPASMTADNLSPFGPVVNATKCASGLKKCLFVHGIGIRDDVGLVDNFTDYWGGQVMTAFPCCSVLKFTHFNTVDRPWYSLTLAHATCNAAIAVVANQTFQFPTSNTTGGRGAAPLDDLVIVSHSSGVMNVASALMRGDCSLSPESSKWVAIQGPILGTHTANNVMADCGKPASSWGSTAKAVLTAFDLCPAKKSTQSLVRNGTEVADACLDGLYTRAAAVFRGNVNASLCGVSAEGISSSDSILYEAMAALSEHENPDMNDGAVSFDSCRGGFPASKYRPTYKSAFYKAALNHADGRLVHGDAWSENQQPIRWLQRQIQ